MKTAGNPPERNPGESRADALQRLAVYERFLQPLTDAGPGAIFADLGCGRGEMLELARSMGFTGQGIETDSAMVQICRGLGLEVTETEPLSWLAGQANDSVAAISALRLAGVLPPAQLQALISEALRVLQPGGLLILETPNIENIEVATSSFYLDPERIRPLPLALLESLPLTGGFARSLGIRAYEKPELRHMVSARLIDVLREVSPVVAVIAQKSADAGVMQTFDAAFAGHYGESLDDLARRFEHGVELRIATAIDERNNEYRNHMNTAESRLSALMDRHEKKLEAIYHSTSWRLTSPVRMIMGRLLIAKRLARQVIGKVKHLIALVLIALVHRAVGNPRLVRLARKAQARMPGLATRLKRLAFGNAATEAAVTPGLSIPEDQISTGTRDLFQKLQERALQGRKGN